MRIIGPGPNWLAKFCPPEFNIKKGCNTVRFGTLYDYRTEENEKLRDAHEGTFSYSIAFPELTKVSHEWLASFEVEADGQCAIQEMEIRNTDIYVKKIDLLGSCHNCWIYCISKSTEEAGNISDTHADKWLIATDKLQEFAKYLGALLWNDIKVQDLPPGISETYSLPEIQQRLSITIQVEEVTYKDRELTITSEAELPPLKIQELMSKIAFVKPSLFQHEQEIRIAFWLRFDGVKMSIANRSKVVNLRPIDKIL